MLIVTLQILASLAMLYFGGERLVVGASALARRIGVSPLAVGLTVVAFGTSAPELVVSINSALAGASDIAVGNVVGSNIANIALILGLTTLLRPADIEAKIIRLDAPIMILVSIVLLGAMANGIVSRFEGILLVLGLTGYTIFTFWQARRETGKVQAELASAAPDARPKLLFSVVSVVLGVGLLMAGGQLLVTAAIKLSEIAGLSQAAVGLTIVAVGTSLPELSTSIIAALRGQGDIAVGNVVGSNIFNILGILGATAVVHPLAQGAITWVDFGVMLLLAVVLAFFLWTRSRLDRIEGVVLVLAFIAYTWRTFAA